MSSPKAVVLDLFEQKDYDHVFYSCNKDHPFVAFTTCYCPVCDMQETIKELDANLYIAEEALDGRNDAYERLVVAVSRHSPELLI